VGTQGYHAPEILDKTASGYFDRRCPEKVDVWGLGIVMYMLLTAMHPFWHKNPVIMNRRIMKGQFDVAPLRGGDAKTSDDAQIFLSKALVVDAPRRFTAAELLEHKWLAQA
jgi:serine/threonine protein kinase